jgi:hypothetical protein
MIAPLLMVLLTMNLSQPVCDNRLDSAAIVKIAKRSNSYWTKNWQYPPDIQFDEKNCEWTIKSTKSRHTNKGGCKHTNGCTEIKTIQLVIDATTGKLKSKTQEKKLYHNYE